MGSRPMTDGTMVRRQLEERSRGPFRDWLAKLLENGPSAEAIRDQAEKHPDRWGQNVSMFGRLSGYTEKLEIEGSFSVQIQELSDSELASRLAELERALDTQSSAHGVDHHAVTGDPD